MYDEDNKKIQNIKKTQGEGYTGLGCPYKFTEAYQEQKDIVIEERRQGGLVASYDKQIGGEGCPYTDHPLYKEIQEEDERLQEKRKKKVDIQKKRKKLIDTNV